MTTAGILTKYSLPTPSLTSSITTGPDGAMWFTEISSNKICRITVPVATAATAVPTLSGGILTLLAAILLASGVALLRCRAI